MTFSSRHFSILAHGKVYSTNLCEKSVSDFRKICGFLPVLKLTPSINLTRKITEVLFKMGNKANDKFQYGLKIKSQSIRRQKLFLLPLKYIYWKSKLEIQWAEPVSLTFHSALRKLHTEPSLGASHQILIHLSKQFQRRRVLEIDQPETRIAYDGHVCQQIGTKCAICIEDLTQMLPTKFHFIWPSGFLGKAFFRNRPIRNKNCL